MFIFAKKLCIFINTICVFDGFLYNENLPYQIYPNKFIAE